MLWEHVGDWTLLLVGVWALFGLYLIGASFASIGQARAARSSKSRRAS